jgi:opacity protein-like surface antigen
MRIRRMAAVLMLAVSWMASAAPADARQASSGEQYAGMWTGTYDGSGTGQFEMTLDKGQDGTMTGKVNVTTEGGNYAADLKSVTFEGAKMTARYDFPLDPSAEVVMTTTFEGTSGKGTWSLRAKGQTDEIASGGIAVTKK